MNINGSTLAAIEDNFFAFLISRFGMRPIGSDVWESSLKGAAEDADWEHVRANFAEEFSPFGSLDFISALEELEHMIDTDLFSSVTPPAAFNSRVSIQVSSRAPVRLVHWRYANKLRK